MALDFGSLKPQDTVWVSPSVNNPTVEWIKDSFGDETAMQVTVPANEAKNLVRLLNAGAKIAELGVSIRLVVGKDEYPISTELWETVAKMGAKPVGVKFRGKKRTARPRKAVVETVAATVQPEAPTA